MKGEKLFPPEPQTFQEELRALINKHSLDDRAMTPDFILAAFLENALVDYTHAIRALDKWRQGI